MSKLIQALNKYQEKTGLSTCELAAKLGLHFGTLYRLKEGSRNPGAKTLKAIIQQFPELKGAINDFLLGDNIPPVLFQSYLPHQILGRVRRWARQLLSKDIEVP